MAGLSTEILVWTCLVGLCSAQSTPCNSTFDCTAVDYCLRKECTPCATICNEPDGTYTKGERCARDCSHFNPWEYFDSWKTPSQERVRNPLSSSKVKQTTEIPYVGKDTEYEKTTKSSKANKRTKKLFCSYRYGYLYIHLIIGIVSVIVSAVVIYCCHKAKLKKLLCGCDTQENKESDLSEVISESRTLQKSVSIQADLFSKANIEQDEKFSSHSSKNRTPAQHSMDQEGLPLHMDFCKLSSEDVSNSYENMKPAFKPSILSIRSEHEQNLTKNQNQEPNTNTEHDSVTLIKEKIKKCGSKSNEDDLSFNSSNLQLTLGTDLPENQNKSEKPRDTPLIIGPLPADKEQDSVAMTEAYQAPMQFKMSLKGEESQPNEGTPFLSDCSRTRNGDGSMFPFQREDISGNNRTFALRSNDYVCGKPEKHKTEKLNSEGAFESNKRGSLYPITRVESIGIDRTFAVQGQDFSGPKSSQSVERQKGNESNACGDGSIYPMSTAESMGQSQTFVLPKKDFKGPNSHKSNARDQGTAAPVSWYARSDNVSIPTT